MSLRVIGRDGIDSSRNGNPPVYESATSSYELSEDANELVVDLTFTTESGVEITKQYQFARDSYEIGMRYLVTVQPGLES